MCTVFYGVEGLAVSVLPEIVLVKLLHSCLNVTPSSLLAVVCPLLHSEGTTSRKGQRVRCAELGLYFRSFLHGLSSLVHVDQTFCLSIVFVFCSGKL